MRKSLNLRSGNLSVKFLTMAIFILVLLLSACSSKSVTNVQGDVEKRSAVSGEPVELNVSAAASLKDMLQSIAEGFEEEENVKLVFNFASSGDLQVQIERGAPADIFISAGKKQMDAIADKGLIDSKSRFNLLSNDLVVVIPDKSGGDISAIEDLGKEDGIKRIAIGTPETVPAGKYAKESLEKANIWQDVQNKLILTKDVHQIINYVATGNVDAGFVYASDAINAKGVEVAVKVQGEYHEPIVYPVAVLKDATNPELAEKYIEYLQSEEAARTFTRFGFKPAK